MLIPSSILEGLEKLKVRGTAEDFDDYAGRLFRLCQRIGPTSGGPGPVHADRHRASAGNAGGVLWLSLRAGPVSLRSPFQPLLRRRTPGELTSGGGLRRPGASIFFNLYTVIRT